MNTPTEFKTWAVVEVMGHVEYAGFVSAETIAGASMLRIDVPESENIPAFTKYLSTGALYGITPCSEETARLRATHIKAKPFQVWGMEEVFIRQMREKGLMIEDKSASEHQADYEDEHPF